MTGVPTFDRIVCRLEGELARKNFVCDGWYVVPSTTLICKNISKVRRRGKTGVHTRIDEEQEDVIEYESYIPNTKHGVLDVYCAGYKLWSETCQGSVLMTKQILE